MFKIPEKHSKDWIYGVIGLLFFNFVILILVDRIHFVDNGININNQNYLGIGILSIIVSVLISLGGFLGAKAYFYTAVISNIIGIFYMVYIALNKTAEGWSDLVSIISYLFIVGIGIILGIVIQVVMFLISKRKRK